MRSSDVRAAVIEAATAAEALGYASVWANDQLLPQNTMWR
jgi:hypothetical protein